MCPAADADMSWLAADCAGLTHAAMSSNFWIMVLKLELELGAREHAAALRSCTFRSVSSRIGQDLALLVLGRAMECSKRWRAWSGLGPESSEAASGGSGLFSAEVVECDCDIMPEHISTPLHSGWAEEYHAPSKCMGQECLPGHISTPLHSRWAEEYHAPSEFMG